MASILSIGEIRGLNENGNVVTVPSGHTLHAAGHVIQVQTFRFTVEVSGNFSAATNYGSFTFTPRYNNSKIVILNSPAIFINGSSGGQSGITTYVYRNGTQIYKNRFTQFVNGVTQIAGNMSENITDDPGTTSTITYDLKFSYDEGYHTATSYIANWNGFQATSTVVMEIAQ